MVLSVVFNDVELDGAAPISARDQDTFPLPLTDLAVFPICMFLAVPQFAVVMLAEPSKLVPFMVLAVASLTAAFALPPALEEPA